MDQQDNRVTLEAAAPAAPRNPLRRAALAVLAFLIIAFAISVFMERRTPITAQATVNAYIVGIAPEVSGRVVDVAVADNSPVTKGQMLFRIDQQQYELAVAQAEAQLAETERRGFSQPWQDAWEPRSAPRGSPACGQAFSSDGWLPPSRESCAPTASRKTSGPSSRGRCLPVASSS